MDKLRSLEVFVAVVDAGSFTRAADRLEMSPVMVGKYIQHLETRLGARLLQRSTRRQGLTDAGRMFYDDSRKVLEQLRWAEMSVERLRATPSGRLRVSASSTLGAFVIAPLVADYQRACPDVQVELDLSNGLVDLIDDGFDLAIRIGEPGDVDLVARRFGTYRMAICASPDYLARYGRPALPADLPRHRCLVHMVWTRRTGWQLSSPPGDDGTAAGRWPLTGPLVCNDGTALRAAALRGAGLLLQPEVLVADDLAAGRLVRVLEDYVPAGRPVHLLYRQDRRPLPKLTSFVDYLLAHAGDAGLGPASA